MLYIKYDTTKNKKNGAEQKLLLNVVRVLQLPFEFDRYTQPLIDFIQV